MPLDAVPSLQIIFKEEVLQRGETVSFRCSAYGNPSPTFEWTVDGELIPKIRRFSTRNYDSPEGDVISLLNISDVITEDSGEYTCTAKNRVGTVSHSARLNIYGM